MQSAVRSSSALGGKHIDLPCLCSAEYLTQNTYEEFAEYNYAVSHCSGARDISFLVLTVRNKSQN
jgi:hypothetical protein